VTGAKTHLVQRAASYSRVPVPLKHQFDPHMMTWCGRRLASSRCTTTLATATCTWCRRTYIAAQRHLRTRER